AVVALVVGTCHVVEHPTPRAQVVLGDRRRVPGRAPPLLELAGIGPQLPHPVDRGVELGGGRDRGRLAVGVDGEISHLASPSSSWARISPIRSIRSSQSASSWSSRNRARRTAVTSALTSCSRPRGRLVTRPASSSTATCFCTAAKLIGYSRASPDTEYSWVIVRRTMSRRVASARARNIRSSDSESLPTTIWL